jgi:O-antigen/teichoic acid export membrane protein
VDKREDDSPIEVAPIIAAPTLQVPGVLGSIVVGNSTVGNRAVRGAMILTAATYISVLLGIVARKWLAILLIPLQFGLIQTALSFVDLILSVASFSFSSAIINVRDNLIDEPLEYLKENIFLLTCYFGSVLSLAAIIIGAVFVKQLGGTIVLGLVSVYAVQRFITSLDTFYTQILERELDYSKISRITLVSNILLHVAAVGIALAGFGAWSIPVATLVAALFSYGMNSYFVRKQGMHAFHARPWKYFRPKTVQWLWRFGLRVLLNRLFESWLFKIDNMLVLWLLGSGMLGYYSQAFAIAQMPAIALAPIVARVSIATYAEIQHDLRRLEEAFAIINFYLIRLLVPAMIFVIVTSKDLVRVFLSSNWGEAAAPLAALAGFVITIPLFENAKMLLGARLKLKEISIVRGAQFVLLFVIVAAGGKMGLLFVGLAVSLVSIIGYLWIMVYVGREVSVRFRDVFAWPLLIGVFVLPLFAFVLNPLLSQRFAAGAMLGDSVVRILVLGFGVLVLSIGIEFLFRPDHFKHKLKAVRSRMSA